MSLLLLLLFVLPPNVGTVTCSLDIKPPYNYAPSSLYMPFSNRIRVTKHGDQRRDGKMLEAYTGSS